MDGDKMEYNGTEITVTLEWLNWRCEIAEYESGTDQPHIQKLYDTGNPTFVLANRQISDR